MPSLHFEVSLVTSLDDYIFLTIPPGYYAKVLPVVSQRDVSNLITTLWREDSFHAEWCVVGSLSYSFWQYLTLYQQANHGPSLVLHPRFVHPGSERTSELLFVCRSPSNGRGTKHCVSSDSGLGIGGKSRQRIHPSPYISSQQEQHTITLPTISHVPGRVNGVAR